MPHLRYSGLQVHQNFLDILVTQIPQVRLPEKRAFQSSLLRWYAGHKRDLPWRKNPDPYRVMVSEFMLQQTRVETVLPYYERFLKTFPTLQSLARASLQSVLKVWAGMGYYARARHLHAAARAILRRARRHDPPDEKGTPFPPGIRPLHRRSSGQHCLQ